MRNDVDFFFYWRVVFCFFSCFEMFHQLFDPSKAFKGLVLWLVISGYIHAGTIHGNGLFSNAISLFQTSLNPLLVERSIRKIIVIISVSYKSRKYWHCFCRYIIVMI
jgi:hypothetical protein